MDDRRGNSKLLADPPFGSTNLGCSAERLQLQTEMRATSGGKPIQKCGAGGVAFCDGPVQTMGVLNPPKLLMLIK